MSGVKVLRIYGPIGHYGGYIPRMPELDGVALDGLTSIEIRAAINEMTRVTLTFAAGIEVQIIEPCVVRGDPEPST